MKTSSLILSLVLSMSLTETTAWSIPSQRPSSSFLGAQSVIRQPLSSSLSSCNNKNLVMYNSPSDPPHSSSSGHDAWTVLAKTEKWISETLQASNAPTLGVGGNNNPYSRKEVSYLYESSPEVCMIVAGIFRRLKEARQLGETHGRSMNNNKNSKNNKQPTTLRQTQVVVMPSNPELQDNFQVFDALIETINQARRRARDLILTEDDDDDDDDSIDDQWSVAVNCAHLHPQFGTKTPEEELQEMKDENEEEEVDLNYQAYQEKRLQARRSPYPTIVIEVRASPAPDFGAARLPTPPATQENLAAAQDKAEKTKGGGNDNDDDDIITSEDIQKLEALFGKSPHFRDEKTSPDDDFYDALANHFDNDAAAISSQTPLEKVQDFFASSSSLLVPNNPTTAAAAAAFTETDARKVDEAYEFVFTNLAMMAEEQKQAGSTTTGGRTYMVVMPHFCSTAATSLEKFTTSVSSIINTLPSLQSQNNNIKVEAYHPEHVDASHRSPYPVVALKWNVGPEESTSSPY